MQDQPEPLIHKCGSCGQTSFMKTVATYEHSVEYEDEHGQFWHGADYFLRLSLCPNCNTVNLTAQDDDQLIQLWPAPPKNIEGLPHEVSKAYRAAQSVKDIDTNAFGVLLGRVLEKICQDRQATGSTLQKKINALAQNGDIPSHLAEMANQLRQLRNVGAHADLGELTPQDVPILDALCRAILEYVYSAPQLIQRVEQRIKERTKNERS